ncbi:MAG: thioredoxin family protein [Bacteroidetes bacterium]|nr:thioredoxin family protein [Bacteroidota bacterium]
MKWHTFSTIEEFQNKISTTEAAVVYFSHESCNVCKVLKPKVGKLLSEKFPKMKLFFSDTQKLPEIAGQNRIFSVPTLLIFFDGKETFRFSRSISIQEIEMRIRRPYTLFFED